MPQVLRRRSSCDRGASGTARWAPFKPRWPVSPSAPRCSPSSSATPWRAPSLGRLSTVIAHEVRNPLMIIKGALRMLAKDGASEADVRDAAKDIDEEIERLNSLVNDVLDVARPIRFDPTPTDINAVCRAAVQAAGAGHDTGVVQLDLAPALPDLTTDGERLRTV